MTTQDPKLADIRAERTARELARINKRLGLVLLLVSIPYAFFILGLILTLAGGNFQVTPD
jgi:hypothetical protein